MERKKLRETGMKNEACRKATENMVCYIQKDGIHFHGDISILFRISYSVKRCN